MNTRTQTDIIPKIQQYLATQPVERAWLFGSFSRGEEREDSDVDILVDFKEDEAVGLFKYCSIMNGMSDVLGQNVDLQDSDLSPVLIIAFGFIVNAFIGDKYCFVLCFSAIRLFICFTITCLIFDNVESMKFTSKSYLSLNIETMGSSLYFSFANFVYCQS